MNNLSSFPIKLYLQPACLVKILLNAHVAGFSSNWILSWGKFSSFAKELLDSLNTAVKLNKKRKLALLLSKHKGRYTQFVTRLKDYDKVVLLQIKRAGWLVPSMMINRSKQTVHTTLLDEFNFLSAVSAE